MKRTADTAEIGATEQASPKKPRMEKVTAVLLKRNDLVEEIELDMEFEYQPNTGAYVGKIGMAACRALHWPEPGAGLQTYRSSSGLYAYVRDQAMAWKTAIHDQLERRVNAFAMRVLERFFPGVVDEETPIDGPVLLLGQNNGSLLSNQLVAIHRAAAEAWPKPDDEPFRWEEKASIYTKVDASVDARMPKTAEWIFAGYDDRSEDHKRLMIMLFRPANEAMGLAIFRAYWKARDVPGHFGLVLLWLSAEAEPDDFDEEHRDIIVTLLGTTNPADRTAFGTWTDVGHTTAYYDRHAELLYYNDSDML